MGSAAGRKVRYRYRLRVSGTAEQLLLAEWDRCRWVWNRCVEYSNAAHQESIETGIRGECGPALLDKHLTGWRAEHDWLSNGSSVAQQQTVRDFGRARAKAEAGGSPIWNSGTANVPAPKTASATSRTPACATRPSTGSPETRSPR